ncbi:MAG TPA: DUF1772 domain-containing protein [Blastocatellia bacterium]|nr:DUF1772 domain-containing protein [Blastocatellia bacterium]
MFEIERENMELKPIRFFSLLFTALVFAPSMAHLLELPNKLGLTRDEYFTVQQIYYGWALLGFVIAGALFSTLVLTFMSRRAKKRFVLSLIALLAIIGTQVLFWVFTYPANRQTNNWIMIPANWESLRAQWEYSHAAGATSRI